jgi:hypothetical protein
MPAPLIVEFPLRGEWFAPNTPGKRVPSHGTDMLGQRYAYDFVGLGPQPGRLRVYRPSPLEYFLRGVRLQECYGWGRPIYAATSGTVVAARDGWPERDPVHPARDLAVMFKNAWTVGKQPAQDFQALGGNYIIIEGSDGFAVYAHAQRGSIRVAPGEQVALGQHLANVGHSGNSTLPHLHFQMMDAQDPWKAQGLPCAFRELELLQGGAWLIQQNCIPGASERIRKR